MKAKKRIKGFTLVECIVGLGILVLIVIFLFPSLSNTLKIEDKISKDKELIQYSKYITENIKSNIYNKKDLKINDEDKSKFNYKYNLRNIGELVKLEISVWRINYEEEKISYEVLLPKKN